MLLSSTFIAFAALLGSASAMFNNPKFVPPVGAVTAKSARSPMFDNRKFAPPTAASLAHNASLEARSIHQLQARDVPAAPRFVVYWDQWINGEAGPPDVSQVKVRMLFCFFMIHY
jgi:hypothetical protein